MPGNFRCNIYNYSRTRRNKLHLDSSGRSIDYGRSRNSRYYCDLWFNSFQAERLPFLHPTAAGTELRLPRLLLRISNPNTPLITANGGTLFCEGGSVLLSGPTSGYNYLWSPGGTFTQNNTVTTSGNYSVVVTDPVTGCSGDASNVIPVTVNPAPNPPASSGFVTQCWNGVPPVPTLNANTVTTVPASSTIFWYDAPAGGNSVALPVLNTVGTITYYGEAKDNVTNCLSLTRTPVTLTISSNPATPVKGPDITACETSPIQTLTATTAALPPAGISILWYTAATGGSPVSPVLSSIGTKTYYAEATNGTCTSLTRSAGVKLTILGAPEPPVSGGDIMQCLDPGSSDHCSNCYGPRRKHGKMV